ncbi:MAG TPA: metallopeptidase family protein [Gemmatimonadales bacterium]|nr:metallopeptidase family protein [Gemmatimonadales bacterium]
MTAGVEAAAFEEMIRSMSAEIPSEYFDGITEVTVSPRAVPHPVRGGVFTLGECIPLPLDDGGSDAVQSRVVLYHGSFRALAELDAEFDWREEAWETLTHELRHHVEWRARRGELEALDRAAEQNFARQDGEPFDPLFHLDGEPVAPGLYHVEGDWFIDRVVKDVPASITFTWHGKEWSMALPDEVTLPAFITVDGIAPEPLGELVVVLRRKPRLRDLLARVEPWQGNATGELDAARGSSGREGS